MAPRQDRKKFGKYFDLSGDKAVCKQCTTILKGDRLFNLKTHLFKVHRITKEEFTTEDELAASSELKKIYKKQVIKIDLNKQQLFRSYIGLVVEDGIPFHVLNSKNMKAIINPICRAFSVKYGKKVYLNGNNCKKVLKMVADNMREEIKSEMRQRLLSLKIDSATHSCRNVFGISIQFISNNQIQSRILGMVELKGVGVNSSLNLATEIMNTLTKYEINVNQIVSITSDGGANMMKTTQMLSHSSIFEEGRGDVAADEDNELYLKNIDKFRESMDIRLGDIQICRCAAHTAQLCALDVTKDSKIKDFLLTCRNFTKYIKKPSNGYIEFFEQRKLKVPELDCPTRWGSTYNMIVALKNARHLLENIESITNVSVNEDFELNNTLWDFIEAYCIAFEPLQHIIELFQQEQLHYGNFYAEWLKCKICTSKLLIEDQKTFQNKIVITLLSSMENRTLMLLNQEGLIACLYLDPRFNHTLSTAQKFEAVAYLEKLYDKMQDINTGTTSQKTNTVSTSLSLEGGEFSDKTDEYLNEYLTQNFVPKSSESIDVYLKIKNLQLPFLRADTNVLLFWRDKQFNDRELYALSNICFAVPASQVTIGRAFSSLKPILEDNRSRINSETLENIILVKQNPSFLDKAIDNLSLFEDKD